MSYSRYFGMRSFENIVRTARFRVPSTGNPFKIGAPVMIDSATPGRLKAATNAAAPGANCGLAIFEHIQNKSDALTTSHDAPYDQVPLGQYAQMIHGVGVKVWFKKVADKTLYDGRPQVGGSLLADALDLSTLTPGTGLVPNGAGKFRAAADADGAGAGTALEPAWLVVEQVNPSTGLVEARFTF
jgi:hypothetical protein